MGGSIPDLFSFIFYGTVKSYASLKLISISFSYTFHLFLTFPVQSPVSTSLLVPSHMFWFPFPLFPIYNFQCLECWIRFLITIWAFSFLPWHPILHSDAKSNFLKCISDYGTPFSNCLCEDTIVPYYCIL